MLLTLILLAGCGALEDAVANEVGAQDVVTDAAGESGEGVTEVPNKYDEASSAPVVFVVCDDQAERYFYLSLFYSPAFELQDPGSRTIRNITKDGNGRCDRCGGSDTVKKIQAGIGWMEQDCTSCSGGCCRYCGGDGWK